ncbi:MAG: hypothetical protein ABJO67_03370 [Pseudoruegeria sp.]
MRAELKVVDDGDLFEYPIGIDDNLNGHYFMAWFFRDWLNSEMRIKGTEECRALYFDLINIAQDQKPVGTLPNDTIQLAKLLMFDVERFKALCKMEFGPLHRWEECVCDGEIRLMHPRVLAMVLDAVSRKRDNRARNEAANAAKRRQRLRGTITGLHADLGKNDAAVIWMDEWLVENNIHYRTVPAVEKAMTAWSNHMMDRGLSRRS